MKTRSIVIVFMIVGIMTALAHADDKQRDRIREQKKIYKQLQDQLREQKQDQLREQKRDGSCQEEDEAFLAFLKSILDGEDPEPAQNRDRIREQKKTRDQLRDQKRDQLREQKQDGSCQDEDEAFLMFLKSILDEEDPEPAQNQDRIREQKKTRDQLREQLRDQKRDQLREQKQDGSCQDEGVLKANDDVDPNQNQIRTRERKKIREHICDQTCEQTCDQVRDQKRDQLREQKQDGSCQDEGVLKANDDADPNQNQTRTRERKKIREHICDQTCDQTCDQVRDQKRDQLREQKQDGSCQDESVLKANDDIDPYQNQTLTREQKKQQDQLKKRNQIWRKIKNYFRWKAPGDA